MQDELESTELRTELEERSFSLACASRGFHEYRKGNLYDPYAIGLYTKIRGKITTMSLVGHLLAKRNFEIL